MAFGDLLINRVLVMSECKGNGAGYSGGQVFFLFLLFTFFANVNVVENLFCTHKMCLLKNVRYLYIYIYIYLRSVGKQEIMYYATCLFLSAEYDEKWKN